MRRFEKGFEKVLRRLEKDAALLAVELLFGLRDKVCEREGLRRFEIRRDREMPHCSQWNCC